MGAAGELFGGEWETAGVTEVGGQMSEVRGRRSEVGGRKSEAR